MVEGRAASNPSPTVFRVGCGSPHQEEYMRMRTYFHPEEFTQDIRQAEPPAMLKQTTEVNAKDASTEPGATRSAAGGMLHPFTVRNFDLLFSASSPLGRRFRSGLDADWRCRQQRHHGSALHRGPTGHSAPSAGARHGLAHVQFIRDVSALSRSGRCALEPVRPGGPLSVQWAPAGPGDAVWDDPTSGQRVLTTEEKARERL